MGWFSNLFNSEPASQNGSSPQFGITVPIEIVRGDRLSADFDTRVSRRDALQVPAVLRSRNLICSTLARLPIHIRDKMHELASPTTLLDQINPNVPNVVTFSSTYEDLFFEGIAWWRVLEFGWHGYPTFAEHVGVDRVHASPSGVFIDGIPVQDNQVVRFDSPNPPLLIHAARAIRTCRQLDRTAAMYADNPMPLGYFSPKEGVAEQEDEQIQALIDKWHEARQKNAWGYVNGALDANQIGFNAEQIQLADQRQHAVLEIARAAGVDPEDLGVSTTSRTYQNSEQRRQDLLDFTLAAYVAAIEERLSMRDILPRGYKAKVNFDGFLRADTLTRMKVYQIGAPLGIYTEDERRDLEDRPPLTPEQRDEIRQLDQPMEPVNE